METPTQHSMLICCFCFCTALLYCQSTIFILQFYRYLLCLQIKYKCYQKRTFSLCYLIRMHAFCSYKCVIIIMVFIFSFRKLGIFRINFISNNARRERSFQSIENIMSVSPREKSIFTIAIYIECLCICFPFKSFCTGCFIIFSFLHCMLRSTLEHYVRVKAKSRVPGGSLGRSFSRSCAGLTSTCNAMEQSSMEARRQSLRVSKLVYNNLVKSIM